MSDRVRSLFEVSRFPQEQYTDPPGDPGLFGQDSVAWRVHADVAMFPGGISALMLQALHPLAMAGVAEHSSYRDAPLERLSRTASFVGATTYGSTEVAESVIRIVRRLHHRVRGVAPDGRPYAADDPALLTWVHVAEMVSFQRANQRYGVPPVWRPEELDRYFAETAVVAERLGARYVPQSRDEVRDYLRSVRGSLVAGDQARDTMRFLRRPIGDDPLVRTASHLLVQAGFDLLPAWARSLYGAWRLPGLDAVLVRPATAALLEGLRLVLGPSPVVAEARARAGVAVGVTAGTQVPRPS